MIHQSGRGCEYKYVTSGICGTVSTSVPAEVQNTRHLVEPPRLIFFILFLTVLPSAGQNGELLSLAESAWHLCVTSWVTCVLKWIVADLIFKIIFNVILFLKVSVLSPHLERPAGGDSLTEVLRTWQGWGRPPGWGGHAEARGFHGDKDPLDRAADEIWWTIRTEKIPDASLWWR